MASSEKSIPTIIRNLPFFQGLTDDELAHISQQVREITLSRGSILFLEGETCEGLYLVREGMIRIFKSSPEGKEQIYDIAQAGDSFNEIPVFDGGKNPASAIAITASSLYLIPVYTVHAVLQKCPASLAISKLLAARLRRMFTMVEKLSFQTVVERLAGLLLELATEEGKAPARRLTQDEMAALVGSVRDVIGRALKKMERAGVIRIEGHRIVIINPEKLRGMR